MVEDSMRITLGEENKENTDDILYYVRFIFPGFLTTIVAHVLLPHI